MTPKLHLLAAREVPLEMAKDMLRLTFLVWPPKDPHDPTEEEFTNHIHRLKHQTATCAIITDEAANGLVVAKAKLFRRAIQTAAGRLEVGALAGVCTHPEYRFHGLAAQCVTAVLSPIESGELPVALWQTGVPGFYEKLGARLVDNRFVNSLDTENPTKNPWWEPYAMIYPANHNWPEGEIDLLGLGW